MGKDGRVDGGEVDVEGAGARISVALITGNNSLGVRKQPSFGRQLEPLNFL